MKTPHYTDKRPRYYTAAETEQPGYLARRMKAYARLQRMRERSSNVAPLLKKAVK